MNESNKKVVSSLLWKFIERGGGQIVQFAVSLVIARMIDPESYGVVAILSVFTTIASVLINSGLASALIQKKDATSSDFSSVFFYSLLSSVICYLILFFAAPYIEKFYEFDGLTRFLRIMSFILFPGAINSIQNAFVAKNLLFKKQLLCSLSAAIISGFMGVYLAVCNFETWALVYQQISYQVVFCIVMWFVIKWRPTREFSYIKTRNLLSYGGKLLGANLIDTLYHNLASVLIGKKYSSSMLAFYNKGKQFPLIFIDNIDGSIQSVMFPTFSTVQDNSKRLKQMVRTTMKMSTYISFPIMIGLATVGESAIRLILGEKWMNCVPFLQIYCLICALFPLQTVCFQAINSLGRSDTYLRIMIIKRFIGVIILFISVFLFNSVNAIAFASLLIEIIAIVINAVFNTKLLDYKLREQLNDILQNLILSLIMGAIVYSVTLLYISDIFTIVLQVIIGMSVFIGLSYLLKNSSFNYLVAYLKDLKGGHK